MDESIVSRYWCHMCSQIVNPIMEMVEIKCPFCQSGFIEEMNNNEEGSDNPSQSSDLGSDRALSLWAPILLGMMGNPRRRRRFRAMDFDNEEDEDEDDDEMGLNSNPHHEGGDGDTELDRELESFIRRRRRSSANILQLLQGIRAGLASESQNSESLTERDERERVILINPFNQTLVVQSQNGNDNNQTPIGSLGDYFIGPGLDMLLQHLAENDPNRYGTPPAKKEAVEALPTVKIKESLSLLQCSVCLDDFEIGCEAKEMPCKHKFHKDCILPWLELHSSCPVCRFQIASDESKNGGNDNSVVVVGEEEEEEGGEEEEHNDGDGRNRSSSGRRFSLSWPFNLFSSSSSTSSSNGNGGSNGGGGSGNGNGNGNGFQANEN